MNIPRSTPYAVSKPRTSAGWRLRTRVHGVFLAILVLGLLQPFVSAAMEHPIVILTSSQIEAYRKAETGALETLRHQRTVTYNLDGDPNRIPHIADQISVLAPRAVIAIGGLAAMALKAHPVDDAPVVFCLVLDHAQALRLPHSWSVSMHVPADEAYERIRQVLPKRRIGIPYDPERTGWLVHELTMFFQRTPIRLVPIAVRSPAELAPALVAARSEFDALWIMPDASFLDAVSIKYLLRYSATEGLPLIGYSDGFTRSGALLSLTGDDEDMGRQAADLAQRVAAGEEPPRVQHPRHIVTFFNLRVAERLRITINPGLVALAERVYP